MRIVLFSRVRRRREQSPTNTTNELFFDLVFAACISTLNYDLSNDGAAMLSRVFHYVLMFMPFWWSYYTIMVFCNRFTCEDMFHQLFMIMQAILSIGMASNTVHCSFVEGKNVCLNALDSGKDGSTASFGSFALFCALLQLALAVLYCLPLRIPEARRFCGLQAGTALFTALVWLLLRQLAVNTVEDSPLYYVRVGGLVLTTSVRIAVEGLLVCGNFQYECTLPEHFGGRMRKFTVVVLGQSLAGLIQPSFSYTPAMYTTVVLILMLAFGFKVLYFDLDVGWKAAVFASAKSRTTVWVLGHMMLAMSFTALGSSSKKLLESAHVIVPGTSDQHAVELRYLICGSVASSFAASVVVQLAIPGAGSRVRMWRKRWRVAVRVIMGCTAMLLGLARIADLPTTHLVICLTALVIFQVLLDMYGRRKRADHPHQGDGPANGTASPRGRLLADLAEEGSHGQGSHEHEFEELQRRGSGHRSSFGGERSRYGSFDDEGNSSPSRERNTCFHGVTGSRNDELHEGGREAMAGSEPRKPVGKTPTVVGGGTASANAGGNQLDHAKQPPLRQSSHNLRVRLLSEPLLCPGPNDGTAPRDDDDGALHEGTGSTLANPLSTPQFTLSLGESSSHRMQLPHPASDADGGKGSASRQS